jgi:hypothetical protein
MITLLKLQASSTAHKLNMRMFAPTKSGRVKGCIAAEDYLW